VGVIGSDEELVIGGGVSGEGEGSVCESFDCGIGLVGVVIGGDLGERADICGIDGTIGFGGGGGWGQWGVASEF
jgi:hypothetical protein